MSSNLLFCNQFFSAPEQFKSPKSQSTANQLSIVGCQNEDMEIMANLVGSDW